MCYDREGNFMGCPAPEFCPTPDWLIGLWEKELDEERELELKENTDV